MIFWSCSGILHCYSDIWHMEFEMEFFNTQMLMAFPHRAARFCESLYPNLWVLWNRPQRSQRPLYRNCFIQHQVSWHMFATFFILLQKFVKALYFSGCESVKEELATCLPLFSLLSCSTTGPWATHQISKSSELPEFRGALHSGHCYKPGSLLGCKKVGCKQQSTTTQKPILSATKPGKNI